MTPRHFLGTDEWTDLEILDLLDRADRLKAGEDPGALTGRVLGMLFFNPSLRTRTSFEVAMFKHGGHAVCLEPGKGSWEIETRTGVVMDRTAVEHLAEAAPVLGRYADALGVRAFPAESTWEKARQDAVIRGFAEHAGVPVINMESARRHPCQGLADAMTLREKLGSDPGALQGRKFTLAWAYHPKALPTAVPVSSAIAAARLGMQVTIARPEGFDLDPDDMETIAGVAGRNGGSLEITDNLEDGVDGAVAVYGKSWGSLACFGDPETEAKRRVGLEDWIINGARMARTRGGKGIFMHCLPVRRGVVVTDEILDGPWSVVVDQAENRLHAQRALLLTLLGDHHD